MVAVLEMEEDEFTEKVAHLAVLTKSADFGIREAAQAQLDELNRLLAAGLLKVGPKGYEHGWIFVGLPGVGSVVHHPRHGRGKVVRHGKRTVGVQFDSGHYASFEHGKRGVHPRAGAAGNEHFADRVDRRKGPRAKKPAAAGALDRAEHHAAGEQGHGLSRTPLQESLAAASRKEGGNPDTAGHHMDQALAAMQRGDHAQAVNHLHAAENAAPDKKTRDAIADQRRALAAKLTGQPAPKPKTKTSKPRSTDRAAARAARETTRVAQGKPARSDHPLLPNTWGGLARPGEVHYHPDSTIGRAVNQMGDDAHLNTNGDALGNVLGHLATDAVTGRRTSQQVADQVRQLRDQVPEGSKARRALDTAVSELHAPKTPTPTVPAATPAPLRQLMNDLHQVPLSRKDPKEERQLSRILDDFTQGRTGGMRLVNAVRGLRNQRHESQAGKFEIDRAVDQAVAGLEALGASNRQALTPPRPR